MVFTVDGPAQLKPPTLANVCSGSESEVRAPRLRVGKGKLPQKTGCQASSSFVSDTERFVKAQSKMVKSGELMRS